MKETLLKLYNDRHADFKQIRDKFPNDDLHGPFLMSPNDIYKQEKNRLLIIGQETYGWSKDVDNLEKQMEVYEDFNVGTNYYSSPFWNVVRKVERAIENKPYSCAWTNISKYDLGGGRVYGEHETEVSRVDNLLTSEIAIIQPTICLFLTGPDFDNRIHNIFGDIEFLEVDSWEARQLSQLKSKDLPRLSFRTYHPNYLRRSGLEEDFINFITKVTINN